MRWVAVLSCLFFLSPPLSYSASPPDEQTDWSAEGGGWPVIQQALEARRRLEDVALDSEIRRTTKRTVKTVRVGKGTQEQKQTKAVTRNEVHVTRQFAIAALDEERGDWHVVLLEVPYPLPAEDSFSFRVLSDGYRVKHTSGRGVTKLNFDVRPLFEDRLLVPYGLKALWGTGATEKNRPPDFEAAIYTPPYPAFYTQDLILRGRGVLYSAAEDALGALRERGVRSKSFPERLLADVIPADLLVNVGFIEQMDPAAFQENPRKSVAEVLMHYALNGKDAFRWIQSPANARGAYQFIHSTYELTVSTCPGAALIPDFLHGTQNLRNMLKAAACLLDSELAKMPEDAKELFDENYRLGGIYPVAAYNGGFGKARKLYATIKREAVDLSAEEVELPKSAFTHYKTQGVNKGGKRPHRIRMTKQIFNSETYLYLKKYFYVWDVLDEFAIQSAQKEKSMFPRCPAPEGVSAEGGAGLGMACNGPGPH
jgi:hypothetical protein